MAFVIDPDGVEFATVRELVDLCGLHMVEIGCGDGRMTFACAEEAASVLAFDPDEESIRAAQAATPRGLGAKIRFEVADAAEIELPESEFDLWEHLRLPAAVRRRLRETDQTPIKFIDTVRYRLLRRR